MTCTSCAALTADNRALVAQAKLYKDKSTALTATLAKVRAIVNDPDLTPVETCMTIRAALAAANARIAEQKKENSVMYADLLHLRPELQRVRERLAESESAHESMHEQWRQQLAAANARIAELERDLGLTENGYSEYSAKTEPRILELEASLAVSRGLIEEQEAIIRIDIDAVQAANARADAAEWEMRESREVAVRNATDCQHLRQSAITLSTERDQLVARARELEAERDLSAFCTPEDRAVLEALDRATLGDLQFLPNLYGSLDAVYFAELARRRAAGELPEPELSQLARWESGNAKAGREGALEKAAVNECSMCRGRGTYFPNGVNGRGAQCLCLVTPAKEGGVW